MRAIATPVNSSAQDRTEFVEDQPLTAGLQPQMYLETANPGVADSNIPTYDLEAAKKELQKSSVSSGFKATAIVAAGNAERLQTAQIIQALWGEMGIGLEIQQRDPTQQVTQRLAGNYEMTIGEEISNDITDPDEWVKWLSAPKNSQGDDYDNAHVDALLTHSTEFDDPLRHLDTYKKIQDIVYYEQPFIALVEKPYRYAVSDGVVKCSVGTLGRYYFEKVWVSD
jgi:peptide/nickel transport system substrate-binding protein